MNVPGDIIGGITGGGGGGGGGGGSTSGGTTTTTSTSGGTSAPSGPSRAELRARAAMQAAFRDVLRRWGLKPSKNLLNLIERGVRAQWSTTMFVDRLRHTPEYRQQFKGIRWKTGMTEGQYLSTYAQYKARAQDIGETITKKEFAKLLKRGVTFDEFSDRTDALAAIETYGPLWNQFKAVLDERGIPVPGDKLTKKELTKFIMGLGSKQWEQAWQEAALTTSLERVAGIQVVGKKETATDTFGITRGELLNIIKGVEAVSPGFELESLTGKDWAAIGARLREFEPSYLNRYGLSTKDLLEMELGGPGAARIAERARRVLRTQEAFFEPRAIPQESAEVGQKAKERREELPQSL